ncbi:hypothetical protein ACFX13_028398 [Malus domestica]
MQIPLPPGLGLGPALKAQIQAQAQLSKFILISNACNRGWPRRTLAAKRVTQSVLPFRSMGKRVWVGFVMTKRSSKFSTRKPGNRRPSSPAPNTYPSRSFYTTVTSPETMTKSCPYCSEPVAVKINSVKSREKSTGHEHEYAPEIFRLPPDNLNWTIQVIQNLYPALSRDMNVVSAQDPLHQNSDSGPGRVVISGFGFHDVVIETSVHSVQPSDLSARFLLRTRRGSDSL